MEVKEQNKSEDGNRAQFTEGERFIAVKTSNMQNESKQYPIICCSGKLNVGKIIPKKHCTEYTWHMQLLERKTKYYSVCEKGYRLPSICHADF